MIDAEELPVLAHLGVGGLVAGIVVGHEGDALRLGLVDGVERLLVLVGLGGGVGQQRVELPRLGDHLGGVVVLREGVLHVEQQDAHDGDAGERDDAEGLLGDHEIGEDRALVVHVGLGDGAVEHHGVDRPLLERVGELLVGGVLQQRPGVEDDMAAVVLHDLHDLLGEAHLRELARQQRGCVGAGHGAERRALHVVDAVEQGAVLDDRDDLVVVAGGGGSFKHPLTLGVPPLPPAVPYVSLTHPIRGLCAGRVA